MISKCRFFLVLCLTILVLSAAATGAHASTLPIWTDFDEALLDPVPGTRVNVPDVYRTVALDLTALQAVLALVPLESTGGAPATLALPMPDGSLGTFLVEESPIMEPLLAARYPMIKTYRGRGIDDPAATTRFGLTTAGFHAIILAPSGTVYIDPYSRGDIAHYISYYKRDYPRDPSLSWECGVHTPDEPVASSSSTQSSFGPVSADAADAADAAAETATLTGTTLGDSTLRTYRLAQAANYEYTFFHTDTPPLPGVGNKSEAINNGIIPTINRVNSIYERDLSVHLNLIDNLELIVWDTPADPYENDNGTAMLVQNQASLDALIGPTNYDIGHVFSTGGGGVAFLGVVCSIQKAGGVTGLPAPIGDPFSVDYVAHEMGHQFGGNHTFNGSTGSCSGGNRNGSTAYEVGSGSTIQAYAGICSPQNLQSNSDDYFHLISYIEMRNHVNGEADTCAAKTASGNTPPMVEAGPDFTIPQQTPFTLTASGSDADGDAVTYCWEEFDLGPAGNGRPTNSATNAPIFRSFSPVPDPSRTFPKLSDVLANTSDTYADITYGEWLPHSNRTMNFRVSARDNQPGHGELTWDAMQVAVVTSAGPFRVADPDGGEVWIGGASATVVWDVANTTDPPVSTPNVNIFLSIDGGLTFPIVLATSVPNNGSATVTAPNLVTDTARVKVQGAGNIFFDISNENFSIEPGGTGQPFAQDDLTSAPHNTSILIDVLANDSDPDGDPLTITFVQSPTDQGGTAVESAGQILYTPAIGFSGIDTFTYTISDGFETDDGSVAVDVAPSGECSELPAALEASALADGFAPVTGDGDAFIDNCENADLSFSVANVGGPELTNVRIVAIRPVSHPDTQIHTPLPAAIAPSIASSCGPTTPATGTFNFTATGLSHGDTLLFEIDVAADELAPFSRTFSLELTDAESDVTVSPSVTFDFEADENGWQVLSGTFDRLPIGGAPLSVFSMVSSAGEDDACDLVRSPVLRLSSTSTLSLYNQFAIETTELGPYDRANLGLFDPAASSRTVPAPDGAGHPYTIANGAGGGACADGEAGWAGVGAPFLENTWSASALGLAGLGPVGREFQIDVKYATDPSLAGAGIQFDQVVITNVLELTPDAQDDDTCEVEPCGDGNIDPGEECDDGNNTDGDGCSATCEIEIDPQCGDGNLDPGEECDDGNNENGDGCSATCTVEPFCGDGNVDRGEECDDGNNTDGDGCSATCEVEAFCGDGTVDPGEECDDGNATNGDGCSSTCEVEAFCGDGNTDPGEECDDGNNTNGDGCSATCEVEGFCGDGTVDPGEECDDGNNDNGDGCSATCTVEVGSFCGDGTTDPGEECDDGNNDDGDGCSATCELEAVCGDGALDPGEECDDGNNTNGDGCSATCTVEATDPTVGIKVTGGGWLASNEGEKINYGFNAKQKAAGPQGNLQLNDKGIAKIHLSTVTSIGEVSGACGLITAGPNAVEFSGLGTFNEAPAEFRVCVVDNGEPGNSGPSSNPDRFYLDCLSGCSYSTGDRTANDLIDGGNIQVHKPSSSGGSNLDDGNRSSSNQVLILDPILLDEAALDTPLTLTVRAFDATGEPVAGSSVALTDSSATGSDLTGTTDLAGFVLFTVQPGSGETEYLATGGAVTSNAVSLHGIDTP